MTEYDEIIEKAIKREIEMMGKPVALRQARKVSAINVDDEGNLNSVEGDMKEAFEEVLDSYEEASGPVVDSLISKALKDEFGDDLEEFDLPERIRNKL